MKRILVVLILIAAPSVSFAAGQSSSTPRIIRISPVDHNSIQPGIIGLWDVGGGWSIEGGYFCPKRDDSFDFWPVAGDCDGRLYVKRPNMSSLDRLADILSTGDVPGLLVDGKAGSRTDLFESLLKQQEPVVMLNGQQYELVGFFERAPMGYKAALEDMQSEVLKARLFVIGRGLGIIALMAFGFFAIGRALMAMPAIIRRIRGAISGVVSRVLREAKKLRVRRVVEDEAIRVFTRSAVAGASETERAALRGQIKQALDTGNFELAKSLTSVLQRFDGD